MVDRNSEKTLQQLKDALPKIEQRIKYFEDIADRLEKAFVGAASKKVFDELMSRVSERREQEEVLQQLTETIMRIDVVFKGKKWTKELTITRKTYEMLRRRLQSNIDRITKSIAKVAKEEIPPPLKIFTSDMTKILDTYIGGAKVDIETSNDIGFHGTLIVFLHIIRYKGKVEDANRTLYVVFSTEFDNSTKRTRGIKVSVFPDRMEPVPFKAGTWEGRNIRPSEGEFVSKQSVGREITRNRIIGLFDYYGASQWMLTRPEKSPFKATKTGLKLMEEQKKHGWILDMNDDKKKGPVIGKSPFARFVIRREHLEGYDDDDNLTGEINDTKYKEIIKDIAKLFPPGRKLDMNLEERKRIPDPTGEDKYAWKLSIRFFEPNVLPYRIKGK